MIWMDVDIALSEVPVNTVPLTSDSDFKTVDEGIAYNESGMDLYWHFVKTDGTTTVTSVTPTTSGLHDWNHQDHGMYTLEIPASGGTINNDTEGFGYFTGVADAVLPFRGPTIGFRAAALNNAMIDGGDYLDVNIVEISGDSTAADNLELQYDTTGLTGGTFPSTQDQVGAIAATSGGTLNYPVADDNVDGALKSITFVGTQTSGTYASTEAEDGTDHVIDDDSNAIDIVYQVSIGGNRTASAVTFKGYLTGANDSINIQAYDFVGSDWETRFVLDGQAGTANVSETIALLAKHTGTSGADLGQVFIRFVCSGQSNPTLTVDELVVGAISLAQSVGYANGAVWVDTINGTAGTESYVNGTADNPVLTWADALTIASTIGLETFHISNGSTITLAANSDNYTFVGREWTLALGTQSIANIHVEDATVTGTGTGANPHFKDCTIGTCSLAGGTFTRCGIAGGATITATGATTYRFVDCYTKGPSPAPIFDFGSSVGNTTAMFANWSGGLQIANMGQTGTDKCNLHGRGKLTIASTCSGGTFGIHGFWTITDSVSGGFQGTTNDESRFEVTQITGGAYALDTDANGRIRIVDGTGAGEINTDSGKIVEVSTLTGHTVQTGDTYALANGATGFAAIDTVVDSILVDTAVIGTAGAGLTAIPWNSSWDDQVQSEVNDGLVAFWTSPAALVDLIWDEDVDSAHQTAGSAGKKLDDSGSGANAADIADAVWDELSTGHTGAGKAGAQLWTDIDAILADTNELQGNQADWATATGFSTFDPTGDTVILGSTGLDNIPTTLPTGVASDFREMVVATYHRFYGKSTLTNTELKTYAANGTDVLSTQAVEDDSSTQTRGAAS